jgi:hypothetical protein
MKKEPSKWGSCFLNLNIDCRILIIECFNSTLKIFNTQLSIFNAQGKTAFDRPALNKWKRQADNRIIVKL